MRAPAGGTEEQKVRMHGKLRDHLEFLLMDPLTGTALTVRKPLALWCQIRPYPLAKGATDCSQPADSQVNHHRGHADDPF